MKNNYKQKALDHVSKPLKGDAWLVRDKDGKMRRGLFFHPTHPEEWINLMRRQGKLMHHLEVVKVRLELNTKYYD
jgi:hypothetical protein